MRASHVICAALLVATCSAVADDKNAPAKPEAAASTAPAATIKDVTPKEAEDILKAKKDVVVLDVRTPEEFGDGHISGARNLDVHGDAFAEQLAGLDKSKTYLLHCASGGRSSRVLKRMRDLNFQSIYHMDGGISAWKDAGKPLQK